MRLGFCLLGIILMFSCNDRGSTVIYTDGTPPIDSSTAFMITFDEDGNVKERYVNKKHFDVGNLEAVINGLNDSCFYEFKTNEGVGKKHRVFKHLYRNESFRVEIENDSVSVGDAFKAYLDLLDDEITFFVEGGEDYKKEETNEAGIRSIVFSKKENSDGLKSFKGYIMEKGRKIPFNYNYVVD
ncbi:MAG: hypothetical protein ACK4ND_13190 [Cytophagaceae bacterium]